MAPISNNERKFANDVKDDDRDVSDLWKQALKNYKGIVGFDLEKKFDSTQDMIDAGTYEMNRFHRFRHNEKKVDQLRNLFKENLDYLEQGTQLLISAVIPVFPPAAAIGTALTLVLTTCHEVSADYDVVMCFFDDMNSFLQRLVILETRLPRSKTYQNCVMDVFTSFLAMCGFAHKYVELGRFTTYIHASLEKWVSNLFEGEDTDLGAARKDMHDKLDNLQNATEFAILGNTEEIKRMNFELENNQKAHAQMLKEQKESLTSISRDTENIRNGVAKLVKALDQQEHSDKRAERGKPSVASQNKSPLANCFRTTLLEVEGEIHVYDILKETAVPDTGTWVLSESEWETWIGQSLDVRPIFAIIGESGSGKSHLAATVYEKLHHEAKLDTSERTCATHFYFKEQRESQDYIDVRDPFRDAITTIINQIAEQSVPLCEKLYAERNRDDHELNIWDWKDLMHKLISPTFQSKSKNNLFVVLDGIDELRTQAPFIEFVQFIKDRKLRVSVVITSRPEAFPFPEATDAVKVEVTKEKQLQDLKAIVWNRINNFNALRNFSRYVQQRIADKVVEVSPNILYAEHLLGRFNNLGRAGAVLQDLDKPMPSSLYGLYEGLLAEVHRRTPANRQFIATFVLHWVAFAAIPLRLDGIVSLTRYIIGDETFDLEEIPEVFQKFIRIGNPRDDAEARAKLQQAIGAWIKGVEGFEESHDMTNPDKVFNDGLLPVKFKERSMKSFFHEPPSTPSHLRWKPSEAHRQIFLTAVKIAQPSVKGSIDERLQKEVSLELFSHFNMIKPEDLSPSERVEVMEAIAAVLSNKTGLAEMLEWSGMVYVRGVTPSITPFIERWLNLVDINDRKSELSNQASSWWDEVAGDVRQCRIGLIKGYLKRLYTAPDLDTASTSFRLVYGAIRVVRTLSMNVYYDLTYANQSELDEILIAQAKQNFPEVFDNIKKEDTCDPSTQEHTEETLSEEKAVLGIIGLFENEIKMDATAYRAVSQLLFSMKHIKPAEETCQKALELCEEINILERFKILVLLSQIRLKLRKKHDAFRLILRCIEYLDSDEIPDLLKSRAMVTKARIEVKLGDAATAAQSYTKAKAVNPKGLAAGEALVEELLLFEKEGDKQEYIRTLKSWATLDQLIWLSYKYSEQGGERSARLRDIVVQTGEQDFIVQMYREAIRYLDNVNAGAPLRVDLALVYLEVLHDPTSAHTLLDEVFDSHSTGWPYAITGESPYTTLDRAVAVMTNVFSLQFRSSRDPVVKSQLYATFKGLMQRPLALDVPALTDVSLQEYQIVTASMTLKVGAATDFQAALQSIIDKCLEGLSDTVGWNDLFYLTALAQSLHLLGRTTPKGQEIQRISRVVFSAIFSRLDPGVEDLNEDTEEGEDSENDEDGDEGDALLDDKTARDAPPADEGDLIKARSVLPYVCDGVCNPRAKYFWWGSRTAYLCANCSSFLCESCYELQQASRRDEAEFKWRDFCARGHEHIKGPIEGWRGVKDGNLRLEGEEEKPFKEFLKEVKDDICKDAWGRFWEGF